MRTERSVSIPSLLEIGAGTVDELGALLANAPLDLARPLIGTGGTRTSEVAERAREQLGVGRDAVVSGLAGDPGSIEAVVGAIGRRSVTCCIAVGGGRVIDTVKQASALTGVPFVSVPTSLSHDGICSPIASLVLADGRRESVGAVMPEAVVVDLAVVGSSPRRAMRAGAGDLLSNLTALQDWRLASARGRDSFDGYSALIAEASAHAFLYLAGAAAELSLEVLARGLVLSGLAMATAGTSRPCSGAEHLISHSLDRILRERARLHGEQVALGTLIASAAHGEVPSELRAAYEALGLPRRCGDLGLETAEVVEAVMAAPATRPERYTILDETDLSRAAVEELVARALDDLH
jgi:glycerol-1-phosphate dehydrogenase [NAD(P)+]